jgi:hypothetical protein
MKQTEHKTVMWMPGTTGGPGIAWRPTIALNEEQEKLCENHQAMEERVLFWRWQEAKQNNLGRYERGKQAKKKAEEAEIVAAQLKQEVIAMVGTLPIDPDYQPPEGED